MEIKLNINENSVISKIDENLYSSFVEHMGRAIYTGIYEPEHKCADEDGFREDVIELIKPLSLSLIRYPGGNFVSGYNWRDGIGPKESRPVRLDLAWQAIEPNEFGIDEFIDWCRKVGVEPMIAVNLGTGTPKEAAELVEYCNAPRGTTSLALLREANGHPEPYNIKYWCLGNEMDGPWQICAKTAYEYARVAHEAGKMIKIISPESKLIACGSSNSLMPTFGSWERTVLRECWDVIDYISLHNYYRNDKNDFESFLSSNNDMDEFIDTVAGICSEIAKEKNSDKKIYLSFDEWNVWYHYSIGDTKPPLWTKARAIDEEVYDQDDSLVVFSLLSSLINHSDSVKISCFAQLVNVIAPITTIPGEGTITRSIYWPIYYISRYCRGTALKVGGFVPSYDCNDRSGVPVITVSAVLSDDEKHITLLLLNKSRSESFDISLDGVSGSIVEKVVFTKGQDGFIPREVLGFNDKEIKINPAEWQILKIKKEEK